MSAEQLQVNFRMPAELKARLEQSAARSQRSLTAEIVHRLEASFGLGDLDRTIALADAMDGFIGELGRDEKGKLFGGAEQLLELTGNTRAAVVDVQTAQDMLTAAIGAISNLLPAMQANQIPGLSMQKRTIELAEEMTEPARRMAAMAEDAMRPVREAEEAIQRSIGRIPSRPPTKPLKPKR